MQAASAASFCNKKALLKLTSLYALQKLAIGYSLGQLIGLLVVINNTVYTLLTTNQG